MGNGGRRTPDDHRERDEDEGEAASEAASQAGNGAAAATNVVTTAVAASYAPTSQVAVDSSAATSSAGAAEPVDVNKLVARAMRAKLMGNLAEYERLQAQAEAARTAAPRLSTPVAPSAQQGSHARPQHDASKTVVEVLVPDELVGVLIGKGGATISTLQRESGAQVKMTSERDESGGRVLLLRGEADAVERAQGMVEATLNAAAEREAKAGKSKKRSARPAKAPPVMEAVPEFDRTTGQLVVVQRKVEVDEMAETNALPDAPSCKKPKAVQRYEGGQRTKFFRDDAVDKELRDLVEAERRGGDKGMDAHFADSIVRAKKFKGISADDEYDYDDGVEMHDSRRSRQSEAQQKRAEASAEAAAERQQSIFEASAEKRFNAVRHLVIAMGDHVYLRLQDHSPIGLGHAVLEPMQHVAAHTDAPEETAAEVRNFQKCLVRMFEGRGASLVFFEQYLPSKRRSFSIDCVPLPLRDASAAPGYFKQELLTSEGEWSQHRKLYETKGCVRGTVPAGFAYFDVSFGLRSGFAHVIEEEGEWPADFGRDVLEGLVDHPNSGIPLARRKKEPFDELKKRVLDFTQAFKKFDWTQQL
mmetsp:Transcript_43541/g.95272  ORF Transcript_43541/g.95272 Transcript_43541/m.95272 type:complete len:587 (-) Transcript_43541:292-2052(-)